MRYWLLVLALLWPGDLFAGGPCSGVKGGCGRSSYRSSARSSSGGSVHVRAYTRKDGTHVRAHTRRAPGTAGLDYTPPAISYRTIARTEARTEARTKAWGGTSSTYEEDDNPRDFAPVVAKPAKPKLKARYIVHFKSGRTVEAADYRDEDRRYWIRLLNGGSMKESKELIDRIEQLPHEMRTWTSPDGRTLEAAFLNYADGTVTLKKVDGSQIRVPIELFSETDREYARTGGQVAEKPIKASDLPSIGKVAAVVDGDTLRLETGVRVRLIGVDTPETVHPSKPVEAYGKEASAFTRKHLEGEGIRLAYDQANAATRHRDKYGRLLAYVVRDRDNFDVNAELIRQGYAHAYTQYPLSRNDEFLGYQREAREQGRGLWAPALPTARGPPTEDTAPVEAEVYVTRTGAKYHRSGCRYLSKSKVPISLADARLRYSPCSVCNPP